MFHFKDKAVLILWYINMSSALNACLFASNYALVDVTGNLPEFR